MVRNILTTVVLILLFSAQSCTRLKESSALITGNQQFRSGDYQESIISYLEGLDSEDSKDYFYYNLGNVYSYLGEYPSAFSVWSNTDGGTNKVLRFNLLYNKGYLQYQLGNYPEAYELFRQALNIQSSSIEAKINLELSLSKMSAANYSQSGENSSTSSKKSSESDETTRILEYVKRKEDLSWGTSRVTEEQQNDW